MRELLKIAHLVMIAMASGLTLAQYVTLRASVGREEEAGLDMARRTLADLATFAVVFVWVSGVLLLWSRLGADGPGVTAWFHAKVGFVLLFSVAHFVQRAKGARLRTSDDRTAVRRAAERWASVAWLMSLLAITLAVVSFG
ncbi:MULTISPECIES: hypothetical protein [unclassified Aureimonas]|uniref:hypothetical protein n=1 Tax=unclassified Aureimonas TaxID=2615206 RepID=UPI0006F29CE6|nr:MULTISPECIES: hypothetical protein [unclassified Aureimonas]KQT55187.1 hypothetical protein ASG62_10110 [Aureimonas sp. Leaf427]KQT70977.1 hypothetical protein ASG54_20495 [Aureimonas sp. Leaf460]